MGWGSGTGRFVDISKNIQLVKAGQCDKANIKSQTHHSGDLVEFPTIQLESDQQSYESRHESAHSVDHGRTVDQKSPSSRCEGFDEPRGSQAEC